MVIFEEKTNLYISRLRTSSHHFAIETGRWHKPISIPYNDRKCIVCDKLDVEYHFVIECTLRQNLRKLYIDNYYWETPCSAIYVFCLICLNHNILFCFVKICL